MSFTVRLFATACVLLGLCATSFARPDIPVQYVIISFDGAHDIAQWKRSRALAAQTDATFTYFLSCVFLLTRQTRSNYHPPHKATGASNVGFAQSREEVAERLRQIWTARAEGHEIASHGCGHFDGKAWTQADWEAEFGQFAQILGNAYTINGLAGEPAGWKAFAQSGIHGFRAPYLSTGKALYDALAEKGFSYDVSAVSKGPQRPRMRNGVVRFALPLIPEGPAARPVIAMDYNLFARHSGAVEKPDTDAVFENRAYDAFRAAFDRQYDGRRIPLELGFHFTLMNGGAYWRALERFAKDVCTRPDVACVSYSDYLKLAPAATGTDDEIEG
jgi:peptidoglycan/xylan/chitin deacetylase (PgdA/CDA1 family)